MDIIVRTAHGTADVAVDVHDDTATLADLISIVSGRVAPSTVLVDERPVDSDVPIGRSGVVAGSLIDTDVEREPSGRVPRARLAQLTGTGAGTVRQLAVGTYRIGPGVRVNVEELAVGRVEQPAFQLSVAADATMLRPIPLTHQLVTHRGRPLTADIEWTTGFVTSGGRTFAHERGHPTGVAPRAAERSTDERGRVLHHRHPEPLDGPRLVMIDARRDAEQLRAGLWAHRAATAAPCHIGLDPHTAEPVEVDLVAEPVVVLTGDADVVAAHARAVLVDAVTRYGPADLEVAVAAGTGRLAHWDWLKWLPHACDQLTERPGAPRLFDGNSTGDLAAFVALREAPTARRSDQRRTVLVVADDSLWSTPRSPLHRLVLAPPSDVSLILLTDQVRHAPAHWTALIEHRDASTPGQAVLTRHPAAGAPRRILAPLPTPDTAADIARHLTALVDPELARPARAARPRAHTLGELVGSGGSEPGAAIRWHTRVGSATPATMPIGLTDSTPITVDLGSDHGVVVSGTSLDDSIAVVRTLLASMAAAWSPHELAIVSVDHRAATRPDPIRALPHDAGTFSEHGARAGRQLTTRVATELLAPAPSARRVAVVIYGLAQTEAAVPGLIGALTRLAAAAGGIHLIVATDEPIGALDPALLDVCSVRVTVDHLREQRHANVHQDRVRTPFTPFEPATTAASAIVVTPRVYGRELTALERHVARNGAATDDATRMDREFQRLVDDLNGLAQAAGLRPLPTLVPRPLPERVGAEALFAAAADRGVPLGLVARSDGHGPVPYHWRPDSSLVIVGATSSAVSSLADVVLAGIVEQYADVPLYVIDADADRRAALGASVRGVAAPGDIAVTVALLDRIERRSPAATTPVLVVADLAALRHEDRERLRTMITTHAVHLVATAPGADAVTELRGSPVRFVVGELDDPADYAALGVADSSDLTGRPGRCLLGREQLLMQVAELDDERASTLTAERPAPTPCTPATTPALAVSAGFAPPSVGRR